MFELSKQPIRMLVSVGLVLYLGLNQPTVDALRPRARIIRRDSKHLTKPPTLSASHKHTINSAAQQTKYSSLSATHQRPIPPGQVPNRSPGHGLVGNKEPFLPIQGQISSQKSVPSGPVSGAYKGPVSSVQGSVPSVQGPVLFNKGPVASKGPVPTGQIIVPPQIPGIDKGPTRSGKNPIDRPDQVALGNVVQGSVRKGRKFTGKRPKKSKYKVKQSFLRAPVGSDLTTPHPTLHPAASEMPVRYKRPQKIPLPRNPVRDFVENRRVKPVAEFYVNGSLTSEFNKLARQPQHDHPVSDMKNGDMKIKWDNDMFFVKWGYSSVAELTKVRRAPHASTGTPWPLPERYARNDQRIFRVDERYFKLSVLNQSCDILEEAISRYKRIILEDSVEDLYDNLQHAENTNLNDHRIKYESDLYTEAPVLTEVEVEIKKPCVKYPSLKMDESYVLKITPTEKRITANEVWGALRGLETLSQLVWKGTDSKLYVMETIAIDRPRFPHRGILIDTSRHYIFKDVIFDVLRGMEHNKMNVLHWHMTDDQSFPFQSNKFPEMSEKGAYHPSYVYTHEDVADIIEFARLRGVRVIPEFDVPGHTYAWGHGRPDVIAKCYNKDRPTYGMVGPIDPSKESTYTFLKELFKEVLGLFPDEFVHAGGDEVPDECWRENPVLMKNGEQLVKSGDGLIQNLERKIKATVSRTHRVPAFSTDQLWEYFENRFITDVYEAGIEREQGVQFLLWQEAATKANLNSNMINRTIAEIWMGDANLVREAIEMGYRVLYSACWYLDMIKFGPDWPRYYECDPAFPGQGVDERKVLGGEACLWGEYVDNENLMTRLWPRASAAAERLWSDRNLKDVDAAAPRLQEQRCRMLSRGLSVDAISGPDYCLRKGRVGGHQWSTYGAFSVRSENGGGNMMKDSVMVLLQVLVVLIVLGALLKTSLPQRMFSSVRHTRHSTILVSFISLIGLAILGYSGLWIWSIS